MPPEAPLLWVRTHLCIPSTSRHPPPVSVPSLLVSCHLQPLLDTAPPTHLGSEERAVFNLQRVTLNLLCFLPEIELSGVTGSLIPAQASPKPGSVCGVLESHEQARGGVGRCLLG